MYLAHRYAWEESNGPIEPGKVLDHLCRNRSCVRLDHLEVVDPYVNFERGQSFAALALAKTHCLRGHPLSGENLRRSKNRRERVCRACQKMHMAAFKAKREADRSLPSLAA